MIIEFGTLWLNEDNTVICRRTELQEFILKHTTVRGVPTISVHGTCREICWKSLGAGLYRVYTKEME